MEQVKRKVKKEESHRRAKWEGRRRIETKTETKTFTNEGLITKMFFFVFILSAHSEVNHFDRAVCKRKIGYRDIKLLLVLMLHKQLFSSGSSSSTDIKYRLRTYGPPAAGL